ncbi:MAG: hypothetical protein MUF22_03835 [Chitinispirillaceae bacterium]|jgi:hypothetical protein|nr:hypothetical protein [Chitinispirillaceae bacterium]
MQTAKIPCIQCSSHESCPQKTRILVNYCGSDQKKMNLNIRSAVLDCRVRRGHLFCRTFMHGRTAQLFSYSRNG